MIAADTLVFLIDIDNTLLDNDRFVADLTDHLDRFFGVAQRERYWSIYEDIRGVLGYADYLGALQKFRDGLDGDPALLVMSPFLLEYPFAERLYPQALDVIAHIGTFGRPVILTDGDVVFQPRKAQRSGVWDAVEGRVLVYVHKELMVQAITREFPAAHYVMIDDKPRLLTAMKQAFGPALTTVWVRQGHYARDAADLPMIPPPDLCVDDIRDLLACDQSFFLAPLSIGAAAATPVQA